MLRPLLGLPRSELAAGLIPRYYGRLAKTLEQRGTGWFAGGKMTVADLKVFLQVRHVKTGGLDYVSPTLFDEISPTLTEHFERGNQDPRIRAYYEPRGL